MSLSRDDACSCFQIILGPDLEINKKKICKILKKIGLNVKVELCYQYFWMLLLIEI